MKRVINNDILWGKIHYPKSNRCKVCDKVHVGSWFQSTIPYGEDDKKNLGFPEDFHLFCFVDDA